MSNQHSATTPATADNGHDVVIATLPEVVACHIAAVKMRERGWDGSVPTRGVIFGGDGDGFLRQVEVAIDPD
jgi:hypothetical protein